jgi:predicted DNA-binding protein (MmcQ/YjbR family)
MTRELIDAICAALPGSTRSKPEEHDSWRVGDKMYVQFSSDVAAMSVKCPDMETANMLIEAGAALRAPYFHGSWVRLMFDGLEDEVANHRLRVAYDTIAAKLPKKIREAL